MQALLFMSTLCLMFHGRWQNAQSQQQRMLQQRTQVSEMVSCDCVRRFSQCATAVAGPAFLLQLAWWGVAFWAAVFYTAFGGKKKEIPENAEEQAKTALTEATKVNLAN